MGKRVVGKPMTQEIAGGRVREKMDGQSGFVAAVWQSQSGLVRAHKRRHQHQHHHHHHHHEQLDVLRTKYSRSNGLRRQHILL